MDPQTNINEQIRLARALLRASDRGEPLDEHDAERLAELVTALTEWLARGGFSPDWSSALRG